jgi:hypothetical protein
MSKVTNNYIIEETEYKTMCRKDEDGNEYVQVFMLDEEGYQITIGYIEEDTREAVSQLIK